MDNKDSLTEEWKVYKDTTYCKNGTYAGRKTCGHLYEVSNYGRVKKDGIIIEPKQPNQKCYYYRIAGFYIHKAVAELWINNPDNKQQIDHIDGNKLNNRADNLRWVTPHENVNNPITKEHFINVCNDELHKLRISKSNKGRHRSEATKQLDSIIKKEYYKTHKGYWTGKPAHNRGKKLVLCEDGKRHWKNV